MGVKTDSVNLSQPRYYEALSALLAKQPIQVWKSKLKFDYIASKAEDGKAFRDERFAFNALFSGAKVQPESESMVSRTDNNLKDLLGQVYVQKYSPEAKQRMDELVNNLQISFKARISKLDWMSDSTKKRAQEKLAAFSKIGYPDKWKNPMTM